MVDPDLAMLAGRLEDARTSNGFKSHQFDELSIVLRSALRFDPSIPESARLALVRSSILKTSGAGPITPDLLLREFRGSCSRYLARPMTTHVLVTCLSLPSDVPIGRTRLADSEIRFPRILPKKYKTAPLLQRAKRAGLPEAPSWFRPVTVHVHSRTAEDAYERASAALDFLRGVWNFALNRTVLSRNSTGPHQPVNSIALGPAHTVHLASGKPAFHGYWYGSSFAAPPIDRSVVRHWRHVRADEKVVRERLRRSALAPQLRVAFIRYARALDGVDLESSLLRTWALLEYLTNAQDQGHKTVVRRALFLWEDHDLRRRILENLRTERNALVHESSSPGHTVELVYQLKMFVDALLEHLVARAADFSTLQECGEYLDQPTDQQSLRARLRLTRMALRLHSD